MASEKHNKFLFIKQLVQGGDLLAVLPTGFGEKPHFLQKTMLTCKFLVLSKVLRMIKSRKPFQWGFQLAGKLTPKGFNLVRSLCFAPLWSNTVEILQCNADALGFRSLDIIAEASLTPFVAVPLILTSLS